MAKILIVDEAELFLKLERTFLKRAGFELHAASTHDDLIEKARSLRPDLVLLHARDDAEHSGAACARRLKEDPATGGIPVILICSTDSLPRESDVPCERILVSPVPADALLEAASFLARLSLRSRQRVPVSLPVQLVTDSVALQGRTKDLSTEGLFVRTCQPPPEGATVQVRVSLPVGRSRLLLSVRGVVVRRVEDDPRSYLLPGAGLRLVDLDERDRRALEEFVGQQEGQA